MSASRNFYAVTNLSLEEIHKILFDGIKIEPHPKNPKIILAGGFSCVVDLTDFDESSEPWILETPENLTVRYRFGWDVEQHKKVMRSVMNWFKHTSGDCVLAYEVDIILLSRIDGQVVRNSTEKAWFPREVTDLIDIPHEVKDLGIL